MLQEAYRRLRAKVIDLYDSHNRLVECHEAMSETIKVMHETIRELEARVATLENPQITEKR